MLMMLVRPPGVYRAQDDTSVLLDVLRHVGGLAQSQVLDVGTGTGALAVAAARRAARVTAVDLSLRSVAACWLNARLRGTSVQVRRGDLFAPVAGRRFDLVLANPPYMPGRAVPLPRHRIGRCWEAGADGRTVLDRLCDSVPEVLAANGKLLLVQSTLADEQATLARLAGAGLSSRICARVRVPFGPVLTSRLKLLRDRGLLGPTQRAEELVAIEASRHD